MPTVCPRCDQPLDGLVDCPAGYPPGCAVKIAATLPAPADPAHVQPKPARARAFAGELGLFVALEVVGLLATPITFGAAGMITSLLATAYVSLRDVDGGRYRLGKRASGVRVVDAITGEAATNEQAILRNLPLALAWGLAILPDPVGLLGWAAVGFLLVLEGVLALARDDGRRLGDLVAGTIVVRDGD
ncbi:MAG: RDD family protein [Alphaproteobacteria bacterium]|nr:RDD family protein [Alphaproteobacteria bacterium]